MGKCWWKVFPHSDLLRLADQSRLWGDLDAFLTLVEQAGGTGKASSSLLVWQQARALLRGDLFVDDWVTEWSGRGHCSHHRFLLTLACSDRKTCPVLPQSSSRSGGTMLLLENDPGLAREGTDTRRNL